MSSETAKRGRGRPPGSRNKNKLLSGVTVAQVCDYHKFNPTEFLVKVANGVDRTQEWTKDDRLRAATKLHDSIHHQKALLGAAGEVLDGQYEIVFVEETGEFTPPDNVTADREACLTLQGQTSAELAAPES